MVSGPLLVEHDVSGFGVDFDVELGHGAPVAHVVATAHKHDFLHALNDARLHTHGHRDIGERAGGNQGDGAWLACHDGFHDVVHRVLLLERAGWHGQLDAVQAAFAVNRGSHFLRAHDGAVASGVHGHVGGVRLFEHRAGVVSHLFEALLASDGGHAQKLDFGLPSASRMATASSCPGSQSRMIFFVTIAPLKEGLLACLRQSIKNIRSKA